MSYHCDRACVITINNLITEQQHDGTQFIQYNNSYWQNSSF